MRGCITGAQIFYGEKLMSYQPVGSNALGCNSRTNAIIDFLLHTLQQWLMMLFSVPDNLRNFPFPLGDLDTYLIYGSLGPPESTLQLASWSV